MKKRQQKQFYTPQEFNQSDKKRAVASKGNVPEINFFDDTNTKDTPQKNIDRFIPQRNPNFLYDMYYLKDKIDEQPKDISNCTPKEQDKLIYSDILQHQILSFDDYLDEQDKISISSKNHSTKSKKNLFLFSNKKDSKKSQKDLLFDKSNQIQETSLIKKIKETRKISKVAYKTLDAPGVQDDITTNIIDWSSKNQICISLDSSIYLWKKTKKGSGNTEEITKNSNYQYKAVKFSENGLELAAGEQNGFVHIYDIQTQKIICDIKSQLGAITSIDWLNSNTLAIGSKDNSIKIYDRNIKKFVANIYKHHDEVLTVKWDPSKNYLASSSYDNHVYIWSLKTQKIYQTYQEHKSYVKGLDWSPHQYGVLATGEIEGEKSIKFWNINQKDSLYNIESQHGICNLIFSKSSNQILTTHNCNQNNMIVWNCENKEKVQVLQGHQQRVYHVALSQDQKQVASCSSDETLKFWKVFPKKKQQKIQKNFIDNFLIELRQLIMLIFLQVSYLLQVHTKNNYNLHFFQYLFISLFQAILNQVHNIIYHLLYAQKIIKFYFLLVQNYKFFVIIFCLICNNVLQHLQVCQFLIVIYIILFLHYFLIFGVINYVVYSQCKNFAQDLSINIIKMVKLSIQYLLVKNFVIFQQFYYFQQSLI